MPQVDVRDDRSVTYADAALLLGVTAQTIRNWVGEGCPNLPGAKGRNGAARVRLGEVLTWRAAQLAAAGGAVHDEDGTVYDLDRARAVDMHYRAISRQAAARRELGQLVPVDLVADAVEEDYQRVRSRLDSVPSRVAVQAAAETDASVVRAMVAKAISDALGNLSAGDDVVERSGGDPSASVHDPLDLEGHFDDDEEQAYA